MAGVERRSVRVEARRVRSEVVRESRAEAVARRARMRAWLAWWVDTVRGEGRLGGGEARGEGGGLRWSRPLVSSVSAERRSRAAVMEGL